MNDTVNLNPEIKIKVNNHEDINENEINGRNINIRQEGLALFFAEPEEQNIYYYDCIPKRYLDDKNLSASVLRFRQIMIVLTVIEVFASLWGFSYYFIRRSIIYIIINCSALVLSFIGIASSIYLNEIGLIFYTLVLILLIIIAHYFITRNIFFI